MKRLVLFVLAFVCCLSAVSVLPAPPGGVQGQTDTPKPSFEVASIKPVDPADHGTTIRLGDGDRVKLEGVTVRDLIAQAYDVRDFQISGSSAWVDSQRYDIEAKAESWVGEITLDNLRPMLQELLADRFQLKLRHETKDLSRYRLVAAKGGPKLREDAAPGPPQGRWRNGNLSMQKASISMLTGLLAGQVGRPVVDETGLNGKYDIQLEWTPDESQTGIAAENGNAPGPSAGSSTEASGPSLFRQRTRGTIVRSARARTLRELWRQEQSAGLKTFKGASGRQDQCSTIRHCKGRCPSCN